MNTERIKELRGYIAEAKAYPYDNGLAHQLNEEAGESLEDLLNEIERLNENIAGYIKSLQEINEKLNGII